MNAVEFAKGHILREIDNDVLNFSFAQRIGLQLISAISRIELLIIRNMVINELNMLEGEEKKIPVTSCIVKVHRNGTMLLEVPKKIINNRAILDADYLLSAPMTGDFILNSGGGLSGTLSRMFNTVAASPVSSSVRTEVMTENLIKLDNIDYLDPASSLSVRVQNNPNLSNLPATTYVKFAELCEIAVQKYIYAHKRKEISTNILTGGAELVEMKAIVDEWSDSKNEYKEKRDEFIAIMNMADIRLQSQMVKENVGNLAY